MSSTRRSAFVAMRSPMPIVAVRSRMPVVAVRFPMPVVAARFPLPVVAARFPMPVVAARFPMLLAVVLLVAAGRTSAQSREADVCAQPAGSTVDRLGSSLARQVGEALGRVGVRGGDVLVVSRSSLPAGAPRGEELVEALVGPVVATVGAITGVTRVERATDAVADIDDLADALAGATDRGYEHLVVLRVGVEGNFLVVQGRVLSTARRWWRRRAPPVGTRLGAPWARARLDVELRSYVGMLPPVEGARVTARPVPLPAQGYVALDVADVDGDERNEIVLLRAGAIEVLRLGAPRRAPTIVARAPLDGIGRAASPRRRAVGSIVVERNADGARLLGRTSEHAGGFLAQWTNGALVVGPSVIDGYPLDRCTTGRLAAGRDHFEAALGSRCEGTTPTAFAGAAFYARATTTLRTVRGQIVAAVAIASPDATVRVRVGEIVLDAFADSGAAIAVADVNDDGDLEVLSSSSADFGARDRLTIRIVRPTGEHRVGWTSPELTGSVLVAGYGDVDDDGLVELLAVEEPAPGVARPSRLWVVR